MLGVGALLAAWIYYRKGLNNVLGATFSDAVAWATMLICRQPGFVALSDGLEDGGTAPELSRAKGDLEEATIIARAGGATATATLAHAQTTYARLQRQITHSALMSAPPPKERGPCSTLVDPIKSAAQSIQTLAKSPPLQVGSAKLSCTA